MAQWSEQMRRLVVLCVLCVSCLVASAEVKVPSLIAGGRLRLIRQLSPRSSAAGSGSSSGPDLEQARFAETPHAVALGKLQSTLSGNRPKAFKHLGAGGFGSVFAAQWAGDSGTQAGTTVAVKMVVGAQQPVPFTNADHARINGRLRRNRDNKDARESLAAEVRAHLKLKKRDADIYKATVVEILGVLYAEDVSEFDPEKFAYVDLDPDEVKYAADLKGSKLDGKIRGVVMPMCTGDLSKVPASASFHDRVKYAANIMKGLAFMHEQGYTHRDIKGENILVCGGEAKLADFGLVSVNHFPDPERVPFRNAHFSGTWLYAPPELFLVGQHRGAQDVWAAGLVFRELLLVGAVGEFGMTGAFGLVDDFRERAKIVKNIDEGEYLRRIQAVKKALTDNVNQCKHLNHDFDDDKQLGPFLGTTHTTKGATTDGSGHDIHLHLAGRLGPIFREMLDCDSQTRAKSSDVATAWQKLATDLAAPARASGSFQAAKQTWSVVGVGKWREVTFQEASCGWAYTTPHWVKDDTDSCIDLASIPCITLDNCITKLRNTPAFVPETYQGKTTCIELKTGYTGCSSSSKCMQKRTYKFCPHDDNLDFSQRIASWFVV